MEEDIEAYNRTKGSGGGLAASPGVRPSLGGHGRGRSTLLRFSWTGAKRRGREEGGRQEGTVGQINC